MAIYPAGGYPVLPNLPYNTNSFPNATIPAAQQSYMPTQMPMQPMTQLQPSMLYGRYVNSDKDITPNDVPTNGSIGVFPLTDYSCIYAKQWNSDGSISTIKYVPLVEAETIEESKSDITDKILQKLDSIEELVKKPQKVYNKSYKQHKNQNGSYYEVKEEDNDRS